MDIATHDLSENVKLKKKTSEKNVNMNFELCKALHSKVVMLVVPCEDSFFFVFFVFVLVGIDC